jgi:hypothetical protein
MWMLVLMSSTRILWIAIRSSAFFLGVVRLPLPAPAEQTQSGEASGEERECGWDWDFRDGG